MTQLISLKIKDKDNKLKKELEELKVLLGLNTNTETVKHLIKNYKNQLNQINTDANTITSLKLQLEFGFSI